MRLPCPHLLILCLGLGKTFSQTINGRKISYLNQNEVWSSDFPELDLEEGEVPVMDSTRKWKASYLNDAGRVKLDIPEVNIQEYSLLHYSFIFRASMMVNACAYVSWCISMLQILLTFMDCTDFGRGLGQIIGWKSLSINQQLTIVRYKCPISLS